MPAGETLPADTRPLGNHSYSKVVVKPDGSVTATILPAISTSTSVVRPSRPMIRAGVPHEACWYISVVPSGKSRSITQPNSSYFVENMASLALIVSTTS